MNRYTFLKQKDVNTPKGNVVTFQNIKDIAKFIINHNYSGGFYLTGRRSDLLLACTNFLIIDIDEKQPNNKKIEDVKEQLKNIKHILSPTKSHQILKNKQITDRYRILLFLDQPITDHQQYKTVVSNVCERFDLIPDQLSLNVSHFFYKSSSVYSVNEYGQDISLNDFSQNKINDVIKKDFQYFMSEIEIPEKLKKWINSFRSTPVMDKKQKFIRILMAQHNLVRIDNEFDIQIGIGANIIPQEFLSQYLNIEPKTIRKWITDLISSEQLEIVCEKYGKGYKGKEYRALNQLKQAIIDSFYVVKELKIDVELPTHIDNGKWEYTLIRTVWAFNNDLSPDRFYEWVKSLPTFHEKPDRQLKAERAWINMKRRKSFLENPKQRLGIGDD